jgi:CMP-N-acetylneuraminic acid synthetase/spore coat polysaccharide biosynthesis predicted glycosyltransferase SpsG
MTILDSITPYFRKVLAIIPARGGSKGIPRKNLRPLAGKPMIYYSIKAALGSEYIQKVVVTTDDEEIALFASRFGAEVIMRPSELGQDAVTLDPVIQHAVEQAEKQWDTNYDIVITIQPTSPLLNSSDIKQALMKFEDPQVDSVISVVDDRHLCWTVKDNKPLPAYEKRVNRQELPPNFKETGAIIACKRSQLSKGTRIGQNVALYQIEHARSFDIDSLADLYLCESILNHKRIVFAVTGHKEVGLGHAYRTVMLANEFVKYEIIFICEEKDDLAREYVNSHNYKVYTVPNGTLLKNILTLAPHLVINDLLDTDIYYIEELVNNNIKVVNFEDLGSGHNKANLVFNALYPDRIPSSHVLTGVKYFCLRDEFLFLPTVVGKSQEVTNVLITFGGVDEGGLTVRVLKIIAPFCIKENISINIVTGPGFAGTSDLGEAISRLNNDLIRHIPATPRISDFMAKADVAITSGGRTVFELAAMKVPTLVICQNERETTHTFASSENGIANLGHHNSLEDEEILNIFIRLITEQELRQTMRERMERMDLTLGKKRVVKKICELLEQEK